MRNSYGSVINGWIKSIITSNLSCNYAKGNNRDKTNFKVTVDKVSYASYIFSLYFHPDLDK